MLYYLIIYLFLNYIIYKIETMDMQTVIRNKLEYYKRLQNEIKARKTKSSSIMLRKQWLEKLKINNYQNEYDRIRGILSNSVTGELTNDKLNKRKVNLEKMGAKIIDQIV